ncbi:MAG TPA: hypothetical protein VN805_00655 [Caulobacteraceae bacterium]|nr:hypothetical protein [Caulobacteraceae bacterium]
MRTRSIAMLAAVSALALAACGQSGSSSSSASAGAAAGVSPPAAPAPTTQPAAATNGPPTQVGECVQTTVQQVGTRLENTPGSGSAISYADGVDQVSYDQVPGIDASQAGDAVKLCLVSLPQNCPPGDDRGKVYSATNLRTGQTWSEADSEHMCGGA